MRLLGGSSAAPVTDADHLLRSAGGVDGLKPRPTRLDEQLGRHVTTGDEVAVELGAI
jgi:hypothetical protein